MTTEGMRKKLAAGALVAGLIVGGPGFVGTASADTRCGRHCKEARERLEDAARRVDRIQKRYDLRFLNSVEEALRDLRREFR